MKKVILCIGREYGSGGHEVGERLAKELGIAFYDKEILKKTAQDSGILEKFFENADENPPSSPVAVYPVGGPMSMASMMYFSDYLTNDKLFSFQRNTILELAKLESCVIIGRCADHILKDNPDMISVFIHADKTARIRRIMKRKQVDAAMAESMIRKTDKKRATYHNYYAENKWGAAKSYDLSVSTSCFGIDNTIKMLKNMIESR